jgi:hypothetical protein
MIHLPKALQARGSPAFETVLRQEIEALDVCLLPLQQGLTSSSHVVDRPFQVRIIGVHDDTAGLRIRVGIFYSGVIGGCSCADDPTPIDEISEYCELSFDLDPATAEASVTLLPT